MCNFGNFLQLNIIIIIIIIIIIGSSSSSSSSSSSICVLTNVGTWDTMWGPKTPSLGCYDSSEQDDVPWPFKSFCIGNGKLVYAAGSLYL
jgi:hypothetical protein